MLHHSVQNKAQKTCDRLDLTCDRGRVTGDMQHVLGGEHSLKVSALYKCHIFIVLHFYFNNAKESRWVSCSFGRNDGQTKDSLGCF